MFTEKAVSISVSVNTGIKITNGNVLLDLTNINSINRYL